MKSKQWLLFRINLQEIHIGNLNESMGNHQSDQQFQQEQQRPFNAHAPQRPPTFSPPPVRRPHRHEYREHVHDTLANESQQQAQHPDTHNQSHLYQSLEEQDANFLNRNGQQQVTKQPGHQAQAPQTSQLYQAEPLAIQVFNTALETFDRYKKQGNAHAMQAFQIIDNSAAMDVQQFSASLYLLQEGLRCYGQVPLEQVKQSLQVLEVEKQKINQQMITLQHQGQHVFAGGQDPEQASSSSQLNLQVCLSQQSHQKQKLTQQQISAADEILRVYKNKRVCLKALLEKTQDIMEALSDPGADAQGSDLLQQLQSQLGVEQSKIEEWILQLVRNQNDTSHFLNEYIRMVENDVKVNQTQSRLRNDPVGLDQNANVASGVSSYQRSELNFKQSKVSDFSTGNQNSNNQMITLASSEPQEQVLCQEGMNNIAQLKEKLVDNLDSLLFLIDEKRIQKHLKAADRRSPTGNFLEYKRDFYTKLYNLSSPSCMSFNRHIAWKLSGIFYKLSLQSQNHLNIGEAGEHARAANQHFLKYKELTKQLSKQPDLELIKYLQHRQFLTKERFERNRHRIAQQIARLDELIDNKSKGIVRAQYHPMEERGREPQHLVSLNNEAEIGTLSRGRSKEQLMKNPIVSPEKNESKLLTDVHKLFPQESSEIEKPKVPENKNLSIDAMRLQQQRSCFPRNKTKQNFNSKTAIGPFGQKHGQDLRELAIKSEMESKKPSRQKQSTKNYIKMNMQPQKRQQQQDLKAQQDNIQKIVKRNQHVLQSTFSPRSQSKAADDIQKQFPDEYQRPLSPDNEQFLCDQQMKIDGSPVRRQNSQSSGTPRDSAYNILKPFQQQQQKLLPFYAPSNDDLTQASQFLYKDPKQKEKRKISLSPREQRGLQETLSTDQTPPQAPNMDISNLQKPSSILQMSAWNQAGPLSVISEEKPYLMGTTAGGHSVSGGHQSPEPKTDQNYQDHTVKGFRIPSSESPCKSNKTATSQLRSPDQSSQKQQQRQTGKDDKLKVNPAIKNRQTSKEKETKRKQENKRVQASDRKQNNSQVLEQKLTHSDANPGEKHKNVEHHETLTTKINFSQMRKDLHKQRGSKAQGTGKMKKNSDNRIGDEQDRDNKQQSAQPNDVKSPINDEARDEGSTLNEASGCIKQLRSATNEGTPNHNTKHEQTSGSKQQDGTSVQEQAPASIYRQLMQMPMIEKEKESPTFSPSAASLHFGSPDQLSKNQSAGVAVSDSSQIQIKIGQKPLKNINQRQFVPRAKAHREAAKQPGATKTVSVVSTQHNRSGDTINQTNGSASKAQPDHHDLSKNQQNSETFQNQKEEQPLPADGPQTEEKQIREFEALEKAVGALVTPQARDLANEDSQLTQKYLETQQATTDKKEEANDCNQRFGITHKDFDILRKLGKGSFGEVYLVRFSRTGELFAMKALSKRNKEDVNWMRYIITERDVLVKCQSPFITKLNYAFQTRTNMFLALEFCTGYDLDKILTFEKYLSEERAKLYTAELILAIAELHQHDIIYRDLKPDNVVLDETGHVKLIDFGMSKEGIALSDQGARTFCGSVKYLAPEMLSKKGHGKSLDWYLVGVLFYEMLVGISPYYTSKKEDLFDNILYGKLKLPRSISNAARDLIMKLLNRSSKKRLGALIPSQETLVVYEDPAVAEYEQKLIEQFSELDLRNTGAVQVMSHPFFSDINWRALYERDFEALPEHLRPQKSKYDMEYHQNRYKASRYDPDDIERIWEQKNNKDFDDAAEADDLHVKNWSFIHDSQIEKLEKLAREEAARIEEAARLQEAAKEQEVNEKEASLKQESSHHDGHNQIVEPVYGLENLLVSPRVAPTIQSHVSVESCSQGEFHNNPEIGSIWRHRRHHSSDTYRSVQTRKTRTRSYQSQFATKSGRRGLSSGAPAERRPRLERYGSNANKRSTSLHSNLSSGNKVSVQSCDSVSINRTIAKQRNQGSNSSNSARRSDLSSRLGSQHHLRGRNNAPGSNSSSTISQYGISKQKRKARNLGIGPTQYQSMAHNEYRGNQIIIRLQNNAVGEFDIQNKGKKKAPSAISKAQKKNTNQTASQKRFGMPNLQTERIANDRRKQKEQQAGRPARIQHFKARPTSNLSRISRDSRMSKRSQSKQSRKDSRSASRGPGSRNLPSKHPTRTAPSGLRKLGQEKGSAQSKSNSLLKTAKSSAFGSRITKNSESEAGISAAMLASGKTHQRAGKRTATGKAIDKRGRNLRSTEQRSNDLSRAQSQNKH